MLLKRAPVQEPPTPPALQVADERYLLSTRREVLSVMQALAKWPVPVSVNLAQLRETAPCRLIAVNPAYEELVFDASGLSGVARLDGSGGLVAEAQLDAVWYRFESSNVEAVQGHGGKAFRARMPPVVARVQRRNSVRYPVPGVNPPVCEVRNEVGVAARLRALDISCSGIALLIDDTRLEVRPGSVLGSGMLHLPAIGAIATDLAVMYVSSFNGRDERRAGCRFTNMAATALHHLRQYVKRLERERLATLSFPTPQHP